MKRKNLLLTLLLALLVPWAANAQDTDTLIIGTGTGWSAVGYSGGQGYGSPFGNAYHYNSATQFIYTADELDGVGKIHSVAFYHNAYSFIGTVNIYLFHTTATTVDPNAPITEGTPLYSGSNITIGSSTEEWQTFSFGENAFEYNGTDNLLVVIGREKNSSGSGSSYNGNLKWQYTSTGDAKYMVRSNDTNGYGNITNTAYSYSTSTNRPNIQIEYEHAANYCPKPKNLEASNLTAHTADLSWQSESGDYLVQYKKATDPESEYWNCNPGYLGFYAYTESYQLTGLDAETAYDVRVAARWETCPIDPETGDPSYSDFREISFTTTVACPAPTGFAVMPNSITGHTADLTWQGTSNSYQVAYRTTAYVDGSEEGFSANPNGWLFRTGALNADGTATLSGNTSWSRSTGNGVFDTHIYMNMYGTKNLWLITPSMEIQDGYALSFDMAYTAYNGTQATPVLNCTTHRFAVLISTDDMQHWIILREWNNSGSEYVLDQVSPAGENSGNIDLSAYAGQTAYIAFFGHSEVSNYDNNFHFDNVAIGTPVPAGEWQYMTEVTEVPCQLTGLLAETKYEATLQGDCEDDGVSTVVGPITFTTDVACHAPIGLQASNISAYIAELSWTSDASEWLVEYLSEYDTVYTEITVTENPYTLTGLQPDTDYVFRVKAICGGEDGESEWSNLAYFKTNELCPTPTNLHTTNVGNASANLAWTGSIDVTDYTVQYRTPAGEDALFKEDFESETSFDNWTFTSMNTANNIASGKAGRRTAAAHNGSYGFCFSSYDEKLDSETYDQYLVSPELTVTGEIVFYFKRSNNTSGETLYLGYSTTTDDLEAFTWTEDLAPTQQWQQYTQELPTDVKYIAFHYFGDYKYYVFVDDITIGAYEIPAGEWETVTTTETNATITGLEPETLYEAQVKSDCSDPEEWSTAINFTTGAQKTFVTEGSWNEPNNWSPVGVPSIYDDVIIAVNDTIPSGVVAEANMITFATDTTILVIASGGQLVTNNNVQQAKVIKRVRGWDSPSAGSDDPIQEDEGGDIKIDDETIYRFYLITNPLNTQYGKPAKYNMITNPAGSYDLYTWDYTEELEWRNYKLQDTSSFRMANGTGYLYANLNSIDLVFKGVLRANNVAEEVELDYTNNGTYEWNGWNLLGNPFMCNAYINVPYYRMNATGYDIVLADENSPIPPMEGFFVQATEEGQSITISRESSAKSGHLNMNLSSGRNVMDKAIITFGDGSKLGKFQLNANRSKVYMTQDGKDYAVLSADNQNEMPVSFKAGHNGTYTLSFTTEEISLGYLHLIDNMTGADVDLLQTPSYTFEARTTDYTSRFRLVFSADSNSSESNFAFFNNGNLVINNEGNATLQVIDVMGRILSSETINGSASINVNAAAGVYMVRLINGENVKVQKVIIK